MYAIVWFITRFASLVLVRFKVLLDTDSSSFNRLLNPVRGEYVISYSPLITYNLKHMAILTY